MLAKQAYLNHIFIFQNTKGIGKDRSTTAWVHTPSKERSEGVELYHNGKFQLPFIRKTMARICSLPMEDQEMKDAVGFYYLSLLFFNRITFLFRYYSLGEMD